MIMYENPNQQGQQGQHYGPGPYEQQPYQPYQQQPYQPYQPLYQPVYHAVNVKNFTRSAWIALGVGLIGIFPGMIVALVFLREASAVQKSTRVAPQGIGCLWGIVIFYAMMILILLLLLALTFVTR